jgi:hypothetical protein
MKKFWNLVILVLAAALVYQLYQGGKLNDLKKSVMSLMTPANAHLSPVEPTAAAPAATPVFATGSETSTPAPEASSTPEPSAQPAASQVVADSTTKPEAVAIPSARPEAVDLSTLDRRYWPRLVKLSKGVDFAIVINGQTAGKASAPAGVLVRLVEIRGAQLVVAMATGSAPQTVAASDTDIQDRVREIMKMAGPSTSEAAATPATASAASSPFEPKLNERGRTPFQRR